jgi:hypothetical protein
MTSLEVWFIGLPNFIKYDASILRCRPPTQRLYGRWNQPHQQGNESDEGQQLSQTEALPRPIGNASRCTGHNKRDRNEPRNQ